MAIQPRQQPAAGSGSNRSDELRVLVATDVLSEGQNLQDSHVVVNYDLPWAIIRLIQRAGRVDRIGQKAEEILCHSFLPADGVERIIDLRGRVKDPAEARTQKWSARTRRSSRTKTDRPDHRKPLQRACGHPRRRPRR